MADEPNKPKDPDASGAGTKAHKPSKAELAKLPGGEDFDVDNATEEDYNKHFTILKRRADLAGLAASTPTPLAAVAAETSAAPAKAEPLAPNPDDIRAVNNDGEERYFSKLTWDALDKDKAGWKEGVDKPKDI